MTEALFDAIDLIHHHRALQFKVSTADVEAEEDDGSDGLLSANEKKLHSVRKNYIQTKLFPELFDLR